MLQCCNAALKWVEQTWRTEDVSDALRTRSLCFALFALSAELRVCVLQSCCLLATEYSSMQNQCVLQSWVCACRAGEQAKLSHKAGVVCNKTLVDPCPSFVRHQNQTIMEHKVLLIKTFFILPGSQCQTWLNLDSTEAQVVLISLFTLGIVEAYFFPQHQFVDYKFPAPMPKIFVGQKLKVGMSVKQNSHFTNPLPSLTLEKAFPSSKTHSSLCPHQLRSVQTLLSLSQNNTRTHSCLCIVWEKTRSKRSSGGRKMANDLMREERDLWL